MSSGLANKLRILALTFGDENTPSTRFRIIQYLEMLESAGICCTLTPARKFRDFASLGDYDIVLLQKTLLDSSTVRRLRLGARRLIYDTDDLIWLAPGKVHNCITRFRIDKRLKTIAGCADLCIAANRIIADDLRQAGGVTSLVPMALSGRVWRPRPDGGKTPLTIGWSGAPQNLVFLRAILPQLCEVQARFPDVRWVIHSGENPHFPVLRYEHAPFAPGNEPATVAGFDIGLLPLPDDPFVRGKSPIKVLQYCASGLAVVADPIGATRELLSDGVNSLWVKGEQTWVSALSSLIRDANLRRRLAAHARTTFEQQHDMPVVFPLLLAALTGKINTERGEA
jgi:glycosyltransferase involved in cell wall biosynthesis